MFACILLNARILIIFVGDIAYVDQDGYFFIVGRIKEMIKVKGMQVYSVNIYILFVYNQTIQTMYLMI